MTIAFRTLSRPLALSAAAAALITLSACSGPAEPAAAPPPVTSPSDATSPSAAVPSPTASASTAEASPSATTQAPGNDALLAAAALAAKEVSNGTVVSVEAERNGWEVHVVTADGGEQQLRTDPTGESIISGPTDDRPDADDRTENEQLSGVEVDVAEAVAIVEREVDGGRIDELSLDLDNRSIVWEADVRTGAEQRSVTIDADSGDLISNRIDD